MLHEGRCSMGQVQAWALNRYYYQASIPLKDAALIARCASEGRVLLTRDRLLARRAEASVPVLLLAEETIDDQARALAATLGIDWQRAPFTRCVLDNAELDPAPPEAAHEVPLRSRDAGGPLLCCPCCGRLYWPGGHVRRMRERLAAWTHTA
jgi:uncharacterized protein with PIN domain